MEITLHCGAHRTATTSFQTYLRAGRDMLEADGTVLWDPRCLRGGIFSGLFPSTRPVGRKTRPIAGRVGMHIELAERAGAKRLLISEENILGSPRACLRAGALYPGAGERMAQVVQAFGGHIDRILLTIRAQDLWWSSIAAFAVARGHPIPDQDKLQQIASSGRNWRDVITDIACAAPDAELLVLPFEQSAGRPDWQLAVATDRPVPFSQSAPWVNRSPDAADLRNLLADRGVWGDGPDGEGRWHLFNDAQAAALREAYADDLMWLSAGADGLATLTEDPIRQKTGADPMRKDMRGHNDDQVEQTHARSLA